MSLEEYEQDELEYFDDRDDVGPIKMCLFCGKGALWMVHINNMLKGKHCICRYCSSIHAVKNGEIIVIGFRA